MIETTSIKREPIASRLGPLGRAQSRASVWTDHDGRGRCILSLPDIRCGGCVAKLERFLNARSDVVAARVNLTLHQANITFAAPDTDPTPLIDALAGIGYAAAPIRAETDAETDTTGRDLLRAIAVAGVNAIQKCHRLRKAGMSPQALRVAKPDRAETSDIGDLAGFARVSVRAAVSLFW